MLLLLLPASGTSTLDAVLQIFTYSCNVAARLASIAASTVKSLFPQTFHAISTDPSVALLASRIIHHQQTAGESSLNNNDNKCTVNQPFPHAEADLFLNLTGETPQMRDQAGVRFYP